LLKLFLDFELKANYLLLLAIHHLVPLCKYFVVAIAMIGISIFFIIQFGIFIEPKIYLAFL